MTHPEVKLGSVANLFSRQMHFKNVGDVEHGHTHQFDHLTLLAAGRLQVTVVHTCRIPRPVSTIRCRARYSAGRLFA